MPKVELNLEDDELKELLLGDRDKAMQSIMAKILDEILKSEATEQIKAKAYERSDERTNSRNGYRVRQLTTRVGTLELHVPKLRHGNFSTQLLKRYQRSEQAFCKLVEINQIRATWPSRVKATRTEPSLARLQRS